MVVWAVSYAPPTSTQARRVEEASDDFYEIYDAPPPPPPPLPSSASELEVSIPEETEPLALAASGVSNFAAMVCLLVGLSGLFVFLMFFLLLCSCCCTCSFIVVLLLVGVLELVVVVVRSVMAAM